MEFRLARLLRSSESAQSLSGALFALLIAFTASADSFAAETKIDVRVLSKGAKFIGTGVAGAEITIRDAETNELLAKGKTVGDSGNDQQIMVEPRPRHAPLSTPSSAVFRASLDFDEPRQVVVSARGPLSQPQSTAVATVTQWIVPGKNVTGGDGLTLELPGFSVDILHPPARLRVAPGKSQLELHANVMMMCGCPIEPDGLWDADAFEVVALIRQRDKSIASKLSDAVRRMVGIRARGGQGSPGAGVGTIVATMLPYAAATIIAWVILFFAWYLFGLPPAVAF